MIKTLENKVLLHIVEGSASLHSYHLSVTGENGQLSLCGSVNTMRTSFLLRTWNSEPGHLRCSYCAKCTKLARELGYAVNEATASTLVFEPRKGSRL